MFRERRPRVHALMGSDLDEAEQLRDDIRVLRTMTDSALDTNADRRTLQAIAAVLLDRRERLDDLENTAALGIARRSRD
jgi:hypothetical protein